MLIPHAPRACNLRCSRRPSTSARKASASCLSTRIARPSAPSIRAGSRRRSCMGRSRAGVHASGAPHACAQSPSYLACMHAYVRAPPLVSHTRAPSYLACVHAPPRAQPDAAAARERPRAPCRAPAVRPRAALTQGEIAISRVHACNLPRISHACNSALELLLPRQLSAAKLDSYYSGAWTALATATLNGDFGNACAKIFLRGCPPLVQR